MQLNCRYMTDQKPCSGISRQHGAEVRIRGDVQIVDSTSLVIEQCCWGYALLISYENAQGLASTPGYVVDLPDACKTNRRQRICTDHSPNTRGYIPVSAWEHRPAIELDLGVDGDRPRERHDCRAGLTDTLRERRCRTARLIAKTKSIDCGLMRGLAIVRERQHARRLEIGRAHV